MNEQASGLIDIIEPAVPVLAKEGNWPWIVAIFAILLSLIFMLLRLWKKKWPAYRAVKRLRYVQQKIIGGAVPLPDGVVLLAQELRHGLGLAQQLPKQAPDFFMQQDKQRWHDFLQSLDKLRYQPGELFTIAQLRPITAQIEVWLRRYCR